MFKRTSCTKACCWRSVGFAARAAESCRDAAHCRRNVGSSTRPETGPWLELGLAPGREVLPHVPDDVVQLVSGEDHDPAPRRHLHAFKVDTDIIVRLSRHVVVDTEFGLRHYQLLLGV